MKTMLIFLNLLPAIIEQLRLVGLFCILCNKCFDTFPLLSDISQSYGTELVFCISLSCVLSEKAVHKRGGWVPNRGMCIDACLSGDVTHSFWLHDIKLLFIKDVRTKLTHSPPVGADTPYIYFFKKFVFFAARIDNRHPHLNKNPQTTCPK